MSNVDSLAIEEWDFSQCPEDRIYQCWAYEFARESPSIIAEYQKRKRTPIDIDGRLVHLGFEPDGNYRRVIDVVDENGEFEDQIFLDLPPGFPDVPYLKTNQKVYESKFKVRVTSRKVRNAEEATRVAHQHRTPEHFAHLHIFWEAPDTTLIKDFGQWLKENRPFPPFEKRGNSNTKITLADLKALGATRLLRGFTVLEAMEHVRTLNRCLFVKPDDWYEAKRRVKRVLKKYFRV